jgi:CubicO group peptidase (beta-lactamase class C family)
MTGPVTGGAAEFEAKLARFVKENRIAGAAASVVHRDELAWAGAAGFADVASVRLAEPGTVYRIASITKTFTGTAVMQLRDAGKLDLDDPAVQWLPELAASGSGQPVGRVTIRRLLSHESGLMGDPPGSEWADTVPRYAGVAAVTLSRADEIFVAIGPNLQLKYSNLGYQLLGEIVRRASGYDDYPGYVQEQILAPLGMADSAFDPLPQALAARCATGYEGRTFSDELDVAAPMTNIWAEGGLWSTVGDLGRWLSFQLSAYGDELPPTALPTAVLSAASLREMHKPRYLSDESWTQAWGISWYAVRTDDVTWVQHSGNVHGFSSGACFDREQGVGASALVNGVADAPALAMELAATARRLAQASPPAVAIPAPTPAQYRPLLGVYVLPVGGGLRRIEWRDGELAFISPNYPGQAMPLIPSGAPDSFTVGPGFRDSGERVRFQRGPDGQVSSVRFASATLLRFAPVDAPASDGTGADATPAEPGNRAGA